MFCAFEGPPILWLYGRGEVLRRGSAAYDDVLTAPSPESSRLARAKSSGFTSIS